MNLRNIRGAMMAAFGLVAMMSVAGCSALSEYTEADLESTVDQVAPAENAPNAQEGILVVDSADQLQS